MIIELVVRCPLVGYKIPCSKCKGCEYVKEERCDYPYKFGMTWEEIKRTTKE